MPRIPYCIAQSPILSTIVERMGDSVLIYGTRPFMGEIKTKRQAYTNYILRLLFTGTALYATGLFNPSSSLRLVKAFRKFSGRELERLRRALRTLETRRLIKLAENGEETKIALTSKGSKRAEQLRVHDLAIPTPVRWDKKWHLVLFDVPEYLRLGRDSLRNTLKRLGFYQIQKSVFVYPYSCEREIDAIARTFEFENHVHCFTVERVKPSYHEHLVRHFGLVGR